MGKMTLRHFLFQTRGFITTVVWPEKGVQLYSILFVIQLTKTQVLAHHVILNYSSSLHLMVSGLTQNILYKMFLLRIQNKTFWTRQNICRSFILFPKVMNKLLLVWKDRVLAIRENCPMDQMLRRQASLINPSLSTFNLFEGQATS